MKNLINKVLFDNYGYTSFRKPQDEIILNILSKNDTVSILPTGAGKSLTFQIPALIFENLTIVISPLISLMKDQVEVLKKRKIAAECLNSTLTKEEQNEVYQKLMDKKVKLLYISPEKLTVNHFISLMKSVEIDFICLDEAHTMMWGLDFRKSFLQIKNFIDSLEKRPVVAAVSATATTKTINEIISLLGMNIPKIYKTSFDRANLHYSVLKIDNKDEFLYDYILKNIDKSGIIYSLTCKETERIYNNLKKQGVSITYYHGKLDAKNKEINQNLFMSGKVNVIVCTISFGMGIDKSNIRYVINYEMPSSIEDLVQMHGRAARDGLDANCFVLYSPSDLKTNEYFIDNIREKGNNVRKYKLSQLKAVYKYCHTKKCLHQFICKYFDEKIPRCNNCSNCD